GQAFRASQRPRARSLASQSPRAVPLTAVLFLFGTARRVGHSLGQIIGSNFFFRFWSNFLCPAMYHKRRLCFINDTASGTPCQRQSRPSKDALRYSTTRPGDSTRTRNG